MVALKDFDLTVERQMVDIFGYGNLREQSRAGITFRKYLIRYVPNDDGSGGIMHVRGVTDILGPYVFNDLQLTGGLIQLAGDFFPDSFHSGYILLG